MTAKRHLNKKTTGQKKILNTIHKVEHATVTVSLASKSEEAIVRQFHRIQRGYSILMNEVVKEYDLIRDWIENEASHRALEFKDEIKHKIVEKIPRF